ncbi:MAG: hypothetical protein J1E61_04410 [Lachnospiraceae bacterium]|nr:hypothetical protein [Lachnospiraceae bacterium]
MMAARKRKQSENGKKDQGSALVLVIIAIAFVGTLVAMLVYMVYFNYLMKFADRSAKNNFYTAETALDIIKAGLEQDVSDAMVKSYYEVTTNHADESALNKQATFEVEFRNELNTICAITSTNINGTPQYVYDPDHFKAYWNRVTDTHASDPNFDGFKVSSAPGNEGARMEVLPASYYETSANLTGLVNEGPAVIYNGSVVEFRNVRVSYTDADGYVSIIKTDITVEAPKINFASVLNIPELDTYSIVAAEGLYSGYRRGTATFEPEVYPGVPAQTVVTGNVFGGEDGIYVNGVGAKLTFEQRAGDDPATRYTVTANSFNAISGRSQSNSGAAPKSAASIVVEDAYDVWAGDLYVESATMDIQAKNSFVKDDLTIDGSYSGVYISGNYNGYGTAIGTAAGNSSILINGAHTTLDLSGLEQLKLAGHAYVGSVHYNANENDANTGDYIKDPDSYSPDQVTSGSAERIEDNTNNDVLMGQSVAVKSDQIMYMVPVECMGYDGDTQILAKNPMTYDEYAMFAKTYVLDSNGNPTTTLKYTAVRLDVLMRKVGGSLNSYGASYVPVFRRVSGDVLVYFYIKFSTDEKANQFFKDYYAADPNAFNQYVRNYLASYSIPSSITAAGSDKLSIAGNMLYMDGSAVRFRGDTYQADLANFEALERERTQNAAYYQNLTKYLMKSLDDLPASQLQSNVFENITVSSVDFDKQVSPGTYKTYQDTAGDTVALVINNRNQQAFDISSSNLSGVDMSKLHLVIANGDVNVLVPQFKGLIFAGGNVYLQCEGAQQIDYDPAEVKKAMTAKNNNGNYVFEVIENGIAYANTIGTMDDDLLAAIEAQREADIIRTSDVVKFVNWNKE